MSENTASIEGLSREELYEKVWSLPLSQLAKSFGIPTAVLAKVCRNHNIPVPSGAYWRSIELKLPVEHTPLPPLENVEQKPAPLNRDEKPPKPQKQLTEIERRIADERREENRIVVAERLVSPHPFVEKTQRNLSNAKPDFDGRVGSKAKGCLDICVGPKSVDRAMRIMDALVKALEVRGYSVSVQGKEGKTSAIVNEQKICFSLTELTDRRVKKLSPDQERERKKNEKLFWIFYTKEYERFPNGNLMLSIDSYSGSLRHRWSDCSTQRLEDRLNLFTTALIRIAEGMKRSRLEDKERARIWKEQAPERERLKREEERRRQEEEQRRREEEQRRKEDQWRAKLLEASLGKWQHAEGIRAFIAAVRAEAVRRNGKIQEGTEIAHWLTWAEEYAAQHDPIAGRELPTYSPDEETRRKLEWSFQGGGYSSDVPWSPPGQPRQR